MGIFGPGEPKHSTKPIFLAEQNEESQGPNVLRFINYPGYDNMSCGILSDERVLCRVELGGGAGPLRWVYCHNVAEGSRWKEFSNNESSRSSDIRDIEFLMAPRLSCTRAIGCNALFRELCVGTDSRILVGISLTNSNYQFGNPVGAPSIVRTEIAIEGDVHGGCRGSCEGKRNGWKS